MHNVFRNLLLLGAVFVTLSCNAQVGSVSVEEEKDFALKRARLIDEQLKPQGITDARVLSAVHAVPRHLFVPPDVIHMSYEDHPLPIANDQTISQPFIVAFMTEALKVKPTDRVLEVGTGSGYQAAILSKLAREVYTIEIVKPLAEASKQLLASQGYSNVTVKEGNGYLGWPDKAPFDCIIVTAAPDQVPQPLIDQLADKGRLVIPVGSTGPFNNQNLIRLTRNGKVIAREELLPVRFVPMTGKPK